MNVKKIFFFLFFFISSFLISEDKLINVDILEKNFVSSQSVEVKRDIFNIETNLSKTNIQQKEKSPIYRDKSKDIKIQKQKEEKISDTFLIKSRVIYEGYILKKDRLMGLLNLDGNFVYIFKGDKPDKELYVENITTKEIIFKFQKIKVKIPLKGESNEGL